MALPFAARCQGCNSLTSRKCSKCNVCVYCSPECEATAATLCFADVACELHRTWAHEQVDFGAACSPLAMLPSVSTPLSATAAPHLRWTALHKSAQHYLHVMLAQSPSRVLSKTAFGLCIALTPNRRYAAGCQRLIFPKGKTSQAATRMIGNMAKLALAQLGEEDTETPQLRDTNVVDKRQALVLSGFVAKLKGEAKKSVVHFDAIYLTHTKNAWTIKRVQPFWEQHLTAVDDDWHDMPFRPHGRVPSNARHALTLIEQALSPPPANPLPARPQPPTPSETPQARPQAFPAPGPSLSPTQASSNPPAVPLPPAAEAAQAPRATPRTTPPTPAPPPTWEAYRQQVQAQVQAQAVPPPWMGQLEAALR